MIIGARRVRKMQLRCSCRSHAIGDHRLVSVHSGRKSESSTSFIQSADCVKLTMGQLFLTKINADGTSCALCSYVFAFKMFRRQLLWQPVQSDF
jgi:hypothetical protein